MKKLLLLTLFSTKIISSFAQIDLKKGLMLYLPFNGNTKDASPNGNDAINSGATLTTDQWGNPNRAYQFNGINNYMVVVNNPTLSTAKFTLCARVDMMGFYNDFCYNNLILSKGLDRTTGSYSLRTTQVVTGDCSFQDTSMHNYRCDVESINITLSDLKSTPYISSNNWDCLIATYENDTVTLYVNGTFRYKYYQPGKGTNFDDMFIGRLDGSRPFWFKGKIDEVRIYDRALNTLERDSICSSVNPTLAITDYKINPILPILSNPVINELILSISTSQLGGDLSVIDLTGRRLLEIPDLQKTNISVGTMPPGVYIVSYRLGSSLMNAKMIKQ